MHRSPEGWLEKIGMKQDLSMAMFQRARSLGRRGPSNMCLAPVVKRFGERQKLNRISFVNLSRWSFNLYYFFFDKIKPSYQNQDSRENEVLLLPLQLQLIIIITIRKMKKLQSSKILQEKREK